MAKNCAKKDRVACGDRLESMPVSNSLFNHFPCPRCGTSVRLKPRTHYFKCPTCDWQDSLFEPAELVRSQSFMATKVMTSGLKNPSSRQLSERFSPQASQKALLPTWLCQSSDRSIQPPALIAPERSKMSLYLTTVAIATVALVTLHHFEGFISPFDPSVMFLPPSPGDEVGAIPPEDAFRQGVNAAMRAATLTQSAGTQAQWQTVESLWSEAIALMEAVPSDSRDRPLAEQKAVEYQTKWSYAQQQITQIAYAPPPPPPLFPMPVTNSPLLPPPPPDQAPARSPQPHEIFRYAVNQAMSAASLTQWAETQEDWMKVSQEWHQAIGLMKSVPSDSPDYSTAQQKAQEYQTNLLYAQQRVNQLAP
ncbi:hypothetical protein NG796_06740 [Laspinema sp. A4]|uniref:hypothetical protein n=1 Tax=Laspinema sp. D2d TaxID=2953686 RepID=UPI0021BBB328|nr:hypothetical protein [Laspinema sp. D2d]MCT7982987.1 hypothetical protein [Laspinema sp. D2d]